MGIATGIQVVSTGAEGLEVRKILAGVQQENVIKMGSHIHVWDGHSWISYVRTRRGWARAKRFDEISRVQILTHYRVDRGPISVTPTEVVRKMAPDRLAYQREIQEREN